MKKSHCAFQFSVNRLFDSFKKVYMWTLTWKSVMPDFRYGLLFHQFMRELNDRHGGLLMGLRVVEVHPGGHGLHYHLLLNMRVSIRLVQKIGKKYGIGHCWVTPCNRESAYYIGKYLSKESPLSKGMRRWGTIGGFKQSRVNDIQIDSTFHRNMAKVFGGMKVSLPETTWVWSMSAKHGAVGNWPDPTHRYTGNPVWVKCCCPCCFSNRRLVGKSGIYLLDRGLKRKLAPFTVRENLPEIKHKRAIDFEVSKAEAAGY